jgi:Zn-dependent peptidase ImmA (M78 family)
MRLPSRVTLPFGYVVLVKQVTDAEMRAQDEDGELADGLWDCEGRIIYLRRSLPVRRRRYILAHEMQHAVADWTHHCFDEEAMIP